MYNTKVQVYLNRKEKEKLKKRAYKNKVTISEYVRRLIMLDNKLNELKNNNDQFSQTIKKLKKYYEVRD